MREIRTVAKAAAEDIYFGQLVMIWARWFLIAAGVILALWNVDDSGQAVLAIVPVVGLVGLNFYLHGRISGPASRQPAADYSGQPAGYRGDHGGRRDMVRTDGAR